MNVSKVKRNSMVLTKKMHLNGNMNKHDKKIVKTNLKPVPVPQTNKPNQKNNNNLYLKSEFNIQTINNETSESVTYIKSLPSHIVKKQYFITPTKLENNTNSSDVKTE